MRLPKTSSIRTAGWLVNGMPAKATAEGCDAMVSRLAGAGLMTTLPDVTGAKPTSAKLMVMVVATVCERLVNVARPFRNGMVRDPCNVPLPALREAVTEALVLVHKLPNWS